MREEQEAEEDGGGGEGAAGGTHREDRKKKYRELCGITSRKIKEIIVPLISFSF